MGHFAKVCKSKIVSRIQEEPTTDSHTESWPEIDHIQHVNGINRIDFYKAILLAQGQPIEFIIDTGSPVTIIPPIISPVELQKTSKNQVLVVVNKNPIKFKCEAMVEVKTEKKQGNTVTIDNREQKYTNSVRLRLAGKSGNWATRKKKHEHYPTH